MKKLEQILKSNSLFNKLYSIVGSLAVKMVGFFVRMKPKTVLFISFSGKSFNDSPKDIYDAMIADPYFDDYTFIWAFRNPDKYVMDERTLKVKVDTFGYLLTALSAQYWVTNVNIERGLHFKKSYTKYINTWHGIPMKYVGNNVSGRSDFNFYTVDLFTYSGDYEYEIYKEAFKLDDSNLFKFGMPRNEILIENSSVNRDEVLNELGIVDKKVILYAPTWREDESDLVLMDLGKFSEALADEYVFLIKMHGLSDRIEIDNGSFVYDVSDYEDTSKLLLAVDVLITDYSSIMFDFGLLNRPILLYMQDYDKYKKERGLYFDVKDTGLSFSTSSDSLLNAIKTLDFNEQALITESFTSRFIEVKEVGATASIIEKVFKEG